MSNRKEVKGAEATVKIEEDKVIKKRDKKDYRHPELDDRIRKERTKSEANIIRNVSKYNIGPELLEENENSLEIEKIEGKTLKQNIEKKSSLINQTAEKIALLHQNNIIHGDLTTKNIIVDKKTQEPFIIDYGLSEHSQRIEDKAVDLHLFKEVLKTSHPSIYDNAWESFLQTYKQNYEEADQILDRLEEIEERGRYK